MAESAIKTNDVLTTCIYMPPRVNSQMPWFVLNDFDMFSVNSLPVLQMQMCVIFFGTLLFQTILCPFGIPKFTSMCIVGILLATFAHTRTGIVQRLFSFESQENLGLLSVFGYMLFLFYIGVKTDLSVIHRTRRIATNLGTIAVLTPLLVGIFVLGVYSSKDLSESQSKDLRMIINYVSFTPFPVVSSVLSELKILNSELGRLGQSSALISEMFSVCLATYLPFTNLISKFGIVLALVCIAAAVLLILFVVFLIRPAMFWVIKQTPEGSPVSDNYVYCILIVALLLSYATYQLGFFPLLGPFILGLAVPEGPPLGTALIKKIDTYVNGVFMPLFVTICAMRVNMSHIMNWTDKNTGKVDNFMVQTLLIVVVASVAKFLACMVPLLRRGIPLNDAVCLSLIMNCKGIVEMSGYSLMKDTAGLPDNVFSLLMFSIVVNATLLPVLIGVLYNPMKKYAGYAKRNIIDLKSELRVLTVIHRPDNIPPMINLLEAVYPTIEQPLYAYVLQLKELIGRASPIFICHQLQKKKANSNSSMAEKLLEAFKSFEREFKGALIMNAFTAISPPEMMYDDICSLALDKFTSLIVLPFHIRLSSDGNSIELEDESLRDLNYQVMERAPCSVGVLIERVQITHDFSPETPYNVCVLFIGGNDDREALCFSKSMIKNPHVRLTVVRFVASNENPKEQWETTMDNKILEDIKVMGNTGSVRYMEESVNDGPETALVILSLVSNFDLIIVGRKVGVETPQISGLMQWTEYPELGVLGDLLVSTDAAEKASVLVIQQQRSAMG